MWGQECEGRQPGQGMDSMGFQRPGQVSSFVEALQGPYMNWSDLVPGVPLLPAAPSSTPGKVTPLACWLVACGGLHLC